MSYKCKRQHTIKHIILQHIISFMISQPIIRNITQNKVIHLMFKYNINLIHLFINII